jgi:hypothetical protein
MNLLILAVGIALAAPVAEEVSPARMAQCLVRREGWDGHSIGASDERGRYQFKPATWFHFSHRPLFWASSGRTDCLAEQDRVARRVIAEAIARLPGLGMPVSPYTIALAWNAGLGAIARREIPDRAATFAGDIQHLYDKETS